MLDIQSNQNILQRHKSERSQSIVLTAAHWSCTYIQVYKYSLRGSLDFPHLVIRTFSKFLKQGCVDVEMALTL
jgi:hypothetical protein